MAKWSTNDGTRSKHGRWRLGRLQIGYSRHIHTYHQGDKRFVFQTFVIWDYGKADKK